MVGKGGDGGATIICMDADKDICLNNLYLRHLFPDICAKIDYEFDKCNTIQYKQCVLIYIKKQVCI